jgi:hypothetical protein
VSLVSDRTARPHLRTDTVAADVAGLFVRVPPPPPAVWPLIDALAQPYGQGLPLTWLAAPPTTGPPLLEKAPLGGAKIDLRASMGVPRTIGTWTDVSSQASTSPGALESIAGLLAATTAADVDRAVANELAGLGQLSGSGGGALVAIQRWPGPRLIVLSPQAIAELRDWREYAAASGGAVVVITDPYIGVNLVIATAGVAVGVLAPASLQGEDPALFGTDLAHAVVYAIEAAPGAIRSWRSTGNSGAGGGGNPLPIPPTISSVVPNTGVTLGGERVRVLGADLGGATAVDFGGAAAAIVFVSVGGTYIDVDTGAHAAGPVDVSVTTPDGSDTRPGAFTYVFVNPPVLLAISPTQGLPAGGEDITLTGTDLTGTSSVMFGPNPATAIVVRSATTVTCVAPAGTLGVVDVSVTTPGGSDTLATSYTYTDAPLPLPTVTAILPDNGLPAGGMAVVITGTNLTDATEVLIGANPATGVVVNNDTEIAAVIPAGALGLVDVAVVTPAGRGTLIDGYTYTNTPVPPPTVTAVTPNRGLRAGATPVVITGTDLTGATAVMFGADPATNVIVANPTTINCDTPAGAAEGFVDVSVTTGEGTGTLPAGYEYYDPATLTNVVPSTVINPAAGTLITLTGTNLTGATQVYVCGSLCGGLIVVSDTTVTCTIPNKPNMTGQVTIHTPSGRADWPGIFTYAAAPIPPPTVTGVNPNSGPEAGGTSVTITGTNLDNATQVDFRDALATNVVVVNGTTITCTTPPGVGAAFVDVTTPSGTDRLDNAFTYIAPPTPGPPQIHSLEPNHGPIQSENPVRIHGKWFAGTSEVRFGTEGNATNIVVTVNPDLSGDDYLDCLTPYSPGFGAEDVYVTTPLGFSEEYVLYTFD